MTERLQEILNRKPSKWGNLTVKEFERDIKLLQERVQELEEVLLELVKQNEELRKSIAFYSSESYNAHLERLLDRSEQQNKRYREALEEISQKRMAYADMAGVLRIARKALERDK